MPGGVEAALVLIVLAGPGFIASRFLNSLAPYRTPTAFQETTQAIIFSAVLVPIWLAFIKPLLASRNAVLHAWQDRQQASAVPGWPIYMPILVFASVYFVAAPLVAVLWAAFVRSRPHIRLAQRFLRRVGAAVRYDEGPEVWDELFGKSDDQRWIRVWFKTGKALEGVLVGAGVSPAAKQLHLAGIVDVPSSLTLLNEDGSVFRDLTEDGVESVWIDVTTEVVRIEMYRDT